MNEIQEKILTLKKERDVLILAHYYQDIQVQDIADHVGDSFALAKLAQSAGENTLILCGVRFMAESAKILNPEKTVYQPAEEAGCPMADMITPEDVMKLRGEHPDAAVVCYVNSTAAVKAVSDICCTSSSAEKVVRSLKQKRIIFIPDRNLGGYVAKRIPEKEFIFAEGWCPVHDSLTYADAVAARRTNPNAALLAHPECRAEVLENADYIGSTAGILDFARKTEKKNIIIATELGVYEILRREFPDKTITLIRDELVCRDMKKTTLQDVLDCLTGKKRPVEVEADLMDRARVCLERMVAIN